MAMKFIVTFFAFCLILETVSAQDGCPGDDTPFPKDYCSCHNGGTAFKCSVNTKDLKQTIKDVESSVDTDTVFQEFQIVLYSPDPEDIIEADTMTELKFLEITILGGDNLVKIDPNAFPGTYETTTEFGFFSSVFSSEDVFPFIRKFTNLKTLDIDGSQAKTGRLTTIPDFAFKDMEKLETIRISRMNTTTIGESPFANLPNLKHIVLDENFPFLSLDGISDTAFDGITTSADLSLKNNSGIEYLPKSKFGNFLDRTKGKLEVDPITYAPSDYHLVCDEKIHWICDKARDYEPKLKSYYCKGGELYEDIFQYCSSSGYLQAFNFFTMLSIFGVLSQLF